MRTSGSLKFILGFFLLVTALVGIGLSSARAQDDATIATHAIIVDFDTGAVLLDKNADAAMPTSSMSKVMTMYMVFEALKDGRLTLDGTLPVSEKAWRMGGSKMFVHVNDQVKVEDLIRGVIVQSGNDATIVLAEGLAGSEEAFAASMNEKMPALGMTASHFANASGWPDPEHYSTARDLAALGVRLIRDFPDYYHYYSEKEFTFNNIKQGNRNPLLYRNIGADGIKTGHAEEAGYGLIGSGVQNGRRVVLVVNGLDSMQSRADESARLLEWGLRNFENMALFKAGETVDQAYVVLGKAEQVPLTVESDVVVTVPLAVKKDLKVDISYDAPLGAPVKKGQKIGVMRVDVPRMGVQEIPLVAAQDVERLGPLAGAAAKMKILLGGGAAAQAQ